MSAFLRKYNTATASGTHIGIPLIKAGSSDFATGSDFTPAAGDVKVSLDGGAEANIGTLPAYTNGWWVFQLTGAELTAKSTRVKVVDSATKAVEDQGFVVETFGHASAMYPPDFGDAARLGLTALPSAAAGAASGLPVLDGSGDLEATLATGTEAGLTDAALNAIVAEVAAAFDLDPPLSGEITDVTSATVFEVTWDAAQAPDADALAGRGLLVTSGDAKHDAARVEGNTATTGGVSEITLQAALVATPTVGDTVTIKGGS